jgi:HK97 family phage prohead protease
MDHILCPFEFKADNTSDDTGTIRGYGSTFGNVDSYGDTVAKGAFKKTIADAKGGNTNWPVMLSQHSDGMPIGVWTHMEENETGLRLQGKLALNTTKGRDAYELLKMKPRPAFNGLSIGYRAKDYELHRNSSGPGGAKRTLKAVDLVECSLVTFPADKFARVASVKSWLEDLPVVDEAAAFKEMARRDWEKMRDLANRNGRTR